MAAPFTSIFSSSPFSFTAIEGQDTFTLPENYKTSGGMIVLAINGAMQNQETGDFSVEGRVITTNEPLSAGDRLYGVYEKA